MRSVLLAAAACAIAACHKQQAQQQNQDIAVGVPMTNETMANADIETLPPDESSSTPSNQLESGSDNPDVNDLNASANSD
jgi:cobalamin biosynthesis protein CbiD